MKWRIKFPFFFFNGENEILVTEIGNHKQKNDIVTNINSPNRLEMRFGENLGWEMGFTTLIVSLSFRTLSIISSTHNSNNKSKCLFTYPTLHFLHHVRPTRDQICSTMDWPQRCWHWGILTDRKALLGSWQPTLLFLCSVCTPFRLLPRLLFAVPWLHEYLEDNQLIACNGIKQDLPERGVGGGKKQCAGCYEI